MKLKPTLENELVGAIQNYPGSYRSFFGVNSNKKPEPILVKKMILMLITVNILAYADGRMEGVDFRQV
jgi:hypothetical protein